MKRFSAFSFITAILAALVTLTPAHAQPTRANRFGVIEPHDAPDFADQLNVGWGRARFHWGMIQPTSPDEWIEAELTSAELDQELAAGREVIGLLIGIPDWAKDDQGLPQGLHLSHTDPDNLWANFVREAVTRYEGRIGRWIIWNEPDVWDTEHAGHTWSGTEADYIQLLRTAYLVAKEENPAAQIHLTAVSHWWDVLHDRELYFQRLLDTLTADPEAAEHNYYYDVATLHLYFNPASIYEIIEQYRQIQADHGIDKPIWLVETNAAPSTDPARPVTDPAFRVSLLEQAAYMPQALALSTAAGAERIAIYKLIDTPGDIAANPEPFGLIRSDESPRPGYLTAQVAINHLSDATQVTWTEQGLAAQVVISRDDSQLTRLLWSRVPFAQQVRVPAIADEATLLDMWGNQTTISPEQGTYTIILYGGECQQTTGDYCMIGGPPVYLIEEVDSLPDIDTLTVEAQAVEMPVQLTASTQTRTSAVIWAVGGLILTLIAGAGLYFRIRR